MLPFRQKSAGSVAATTTASAAAPLSTLFDASTPHQIELEAEGATIYVLFGDSNVVADLSKTGNDYDYNLLRVPVGAVKLFTIEGSYTHYSVITASGSGTLHFAEGHGE